MFFHHVDPIGSFVRFFSRRLSPWWSAIVTGYFLSWVDLLITLDIPEESSSEGRLHWIMEVISATKPEKGHTSYIIYVMCSIHITILYIAR